MFCWNTACGDEDQQKWHEGGTWEKHKMRDRSREEDVREAKVGYSQCYWLLALISSLLGKIEPIFLAETCKESSLLTVTKRQKGSGWKVWLWHLFSALRDFSGRWSWLTGHCHKFHQSGHRFVEEDAGEGNTWCRLFCDDIKMVKLNVFADKSSWKIRVVSERCPSNPFPNV